MDTILEEFESLQLPQVDLDEGDKDDDISVESILKSLREDFGDGEFPDEWEVNDDEYEVKRDENPTDGEPR